MNCEKHKQYLWDDIANLNSYLNIAPPELPDVNSCGGVDLSSCLMIHFLPLLLIIYRKKHL